jgi:hypothetical protein
MLFMTTLFKIGHSLIFLPNFFLYSTYPCDILTF